MNSILSRITEIKQQEVAEAKKNAPLSSLVLNRPLKDFIEPLRTEKVAIITEIKKASPSKGIIREDFDVTRIAQTYAQNGASCLSVLTDIQFFQGHPGNLAIAKSACDLPVLRKDFIIDPYQIYESRHLGADCILLIAAILDKHQLEDYCQLAQELGMAVLVETHDQQEVELAVALPTPLIGINNRNLHTFKTDLNLSLELKQHIPNDKIVISESGINSRQDILNLYHSGISKFLIGESLMREPDIGKALLNLLQ
ncbi:indole-3-glycerol phosphate synthase (plasmid) [Legionella adelaidensis]|uniref:Indole-3-glycerol phosphate synthase n=1 Tax=Legionella adelaidensis TaxID=45056 RepID=A0A0W0R3W1_9GAMM|nr:indole-3-glycerol phosphate synthase TrpC [Legionella adelaidensis]KTC65722.1 indole-3-glycerol phosphate synthase [Legionella adelaidensis]VEH85112.1 indole-3-glycerol phosphate synthase [Legionella adelaidensis]